MLKVKEAIHDRDSKYSGNISEASYDNVVIQSAHYKYYRRGKPVKAFRQGRDTTGIFLIIIVNNKILLLDLILLDLIIKHYY